MADLKEFREATFDQDIWQSVVDNNEYELPERLEPGDAIVDLGAHIGAFARACIDRGARRILCFEPDLGNMCLLCANLREEIHQGWVEPFALAVGAEGLTFQEHSGYTSVGDTINTGGGYLVSCDKKYSGSETASGQRMTVPVIGVNYLMALVENIRLLKMDVEGSEFSILNSFNFYGSVQEIVGEYHCQPERDHNWIHEKLKPLGFSVRSERGIMGKFWAKRE